MDVEVKEVTSLKELGAFIRFPFTLYRGNPYWVPPLISDEYNTLRRDKNPAFEHSEAKYWLAYSQGKIVGRIAGIVNHLHIEKWGQRYVRFGWVDFVDDPAVSSALFQTVEAWAKQNGMVAVHGPLGFSDMDKEGMLVEGFDEFATLITIYNHPYYKTHLENLGYVKDTDWVEYEIVAPKQPNETIAKAAEIVLRRNHLKVLRLKNKAGIMARARELFQLYDEEYKLLYGFVPLNEKQVDLYIQQYFNFISPDFVPIVVDENDRMVAFGIVLPSLTRALQKANGNLFPFGFLHLLRALGKNDRADLCLIAVRSAYQGKGVNAILMDEIMKVFIRRGVKLVESNPELETNLAVQAQWKYFEKRQHKRRRCYIKQLA